MTTPIHSVFFLALLSLFVPTTPLLAAEQPMSQLQIAVVQVRPIGAFTSIGGTVVPVREITFTAQLPARVELIAGNEGDFFAKGKTLVALDEEELLAQRRAAVAQISSAEAALRNAQVQFSRERQSPTSTNMMDQIMPGMGDLMGNNTKGVDRRANLHSYSTQIEQARSGLLQAQSQLQELDAKLRDAKSVAPFDGYIIRKHVNQGDTVHPGQPLVEFADMRQLQLQADIPNRLASTLWQGALVKIKLDNKQQSQLTAKVSQIFPMADPSRHTVRIKFDLPPSSLARAGMYAEVMLPEPGHQHSSYPIIPLSAVVNKGGLPMVYVIGHDQQPRLHLLRLGEQLSNNEVVVLTGLQGGEQILLNPQAY